MTRPFDRLTPDTQGFDVSEYNRLLDTVQRQSASQGVGLPTFDTGAGSGSWMRGDISRMIFIQVSAITIVSSSSVPVVPAYDWAEVVRVDGLYARPGDGRSGTAVLFPAFDTNMSATVPLNSGSTTSAYLAWLSWDEKSVEFIGPDLDVPVQTCRDSCGSTFPILYRISADGYVGGLFSDQPGSFDHWARANLIGYLAPDPGDPGTYLPDAPFGILADGTYVRWQLLSELFQGIVFTSGIPAGSSIFSENNYGGSLRNKHLFDGPDVFLLRRGYSSSSVFNPQPNNFTSVNIISLLHNGSIIYRSPNELCDGSLLLDWFDNGLLPSSVLTFPTKIRLDVIRTGSCPYIPTDPVMRTLFFSYPAIGCPSYFPLGCERLGVVMYPRGGNVWEGFYAGIGVHPPGAAGDAVCFGDAAIKLEYLGGIRWRATIWFNIDGYLSVNPNAVLLADFEGDVPMDQLNNRQIFKSIPVKTKYQAFCPNAGSIFGEPGAFYWY